MGEGTSWNQGEGTGIPGTTVVIWSQKFQQEPREFPDRPLREGGVGLLGDLDSELVEGRENDPALRGEMIKENLLYSTGKPTQ